MTRARHLGILTVKAITMVAILSVLLIVGVLIWQFQSQMPTVDIGAGVPVGSIQKTVTVQPGAATGSAVGITDVAPIDQVDPPVALPVTVGSYQTYRPELLSLANGGKVVLFFHAAWCPTCRSLNSNIESNLASIPSGVHILKTDYDTYTELKRKYGVTYQHTMVQVDVNGNQLAKWSGSPTLSSLIGNIK